MIFWFARFEKKIRKQQYHLLISTNAGGAVTPPFSFTDESAGATAE
jgi:hypothetical protein